MRTGGPGRKWMLRIWMASICFVSGVLLIGVGAASATPTTVTLAGCETCFGVTYTLEFSQTNSIVDYKLTVDTTGYSGEGTVLNAVSVKTVSASTNFNFIAQSPQAGFNNFIAGSIGSASGCTAGSNGFICSAWTNSGGAAVGSVYEWTWQKELLNGGTLLAAGDMSMKALYMRPDGDGFKKAGQTSDTFRVPLPGTFLMFGAGLIGFAVWQRRSGLAV